MNPATSLVEDALTIMQPWGSIIAGLPGLTRPKRVENREWLPPPRIAGRWLAIHAGKGFDHAGLMALRGLGVRAIDWPRGAVIACCRVTGYLDARDGTPRLQGDLPAWARSAMAVEEHTWWTGPVGWLLDDVVTIEPVACRGALGVWRLGEHGPAVSAALVAALGARA
jgi:hypothetical protein